MGRQAGRIAEQLRAYVAQVFKSLCIEIDKELREATPIDTGNARAGWVPSVGQPTIIERGDEIAHAIGMAQVLSFKLGDGALWVSNGVDYVPILNTGTSAQAPPEWIETAIDRAMATIRARFDVSIDISRGLL